MNVVTKSALALPVARETLYRGIALLAAIVSHVVVPGAFTMLLLLMAR
jgi:hypothetical protein